MDVSWVLELVVGAKELADSARVGEKPRHDQRKLLHAKSIIEALRLIYFAPRGVILLLDDLAKGGRPNREEIELILPRFNDGEHFVERMLFRLDPSDGQPDGFLTLRAERVLREIAYGKGGIREKVQALLNEALTYDQDIPADEAAKLRDEILALNKAIEDAEEALVVSMRSETRRRS
ncbi:hypothetical protein [Thalassovita taeanensis]|uniref:Uncharacterized protein n=1 Tax=Thalassovita taeanensis TaxID=657014 RepID=A0A1H9E1N2_9RHOB|nr:hypothetical protein [Thalassovita taeanensis]SEQ18848.1 hypothetical protein SAMN04488092_104340 [Thalassovita taeanensis]